MADARSSDESNDSVDDHQPTVHVDYRVFEITVEGGSDDSLEDVESVMNSRIAQAMTDIEDMKRTDFELDEEYEVDRSSDGHAGMSY